MNKDATQPMKTKRIPNCLHITNSFVNEWVMTIIEFCLNRSADNEERERNDEVICR